METAHALFQLLDTDKSGSLEKREILKATRDNKKIQTLIESNDKLKSLFNPSTYRTAFDSINTSADGHVTLKEFASFLEAVEAMEGAEQPGAVLELPKKEEPATILAPGEVPKQEYVEKGTAARPSPPGPPKKYSDESEGTVHLIKPKVPPIPPKKEENEKESVAASRPPGPPKKVNNKSNRRANDDSIHGPPEPPKKEDEETKVVDQPGPPGSPKNSSVSDDRSASEKSGPPGPPSRKSSDNGEKTRSNVPHAPPKPQKNSQKERIPVDQKEEGDHDESESDSEADELEEKAEIARHQLEEARENLGIPEPSNFSGLFANSISEKSIVQSTDLTKSGNESSDTRLVLKKTPKKNPDDIYAGLLPPKRQFSASPEHKRVRVPSLWGWRPVSRAQTAPVQSLPGIGALAASIEPSAIMTAEERQVLYDDMSQKIPMAKGLQILFREVEGLLRYSPTARRFQDLEERKKKQELMEKFRFHHAQTFFTNLRECLVILQNLPDDWGQPFLDEYWGWHFLNLAEKLNYALREADWLPEQAKPHCRAPQLAILEYKEYVIMRSRRIAEAEAHGRSPKNSIERNVDEISQLLTPALPRSSIVRLPKRDKHVSDWSKLITRGTKVLQCKKGVAAIGNAMILLCRYTPEAKRFSNIERRKKMVSHVTNFHLDICRKVYHCIENSCNVMSSLPSTFIDENNSFWEMQLQEDAALVTTALNEVDWLPEAAKATFRRAVYSCEKFEVYILRMQKTCRLTRSSGGRRPSILPRMTGVGFFPEEHLIMSHEQHIDVQEEAHMLLPNVKKGLRAISAAVEKLKVFQPAAGRFQNDGEKRMRLAEMKDFAHSQGQKFHIELKQIVHLRKQLPADWVDKYDDYWDMHLGDIAANMQEALMEIDWLPEAAKPTLRAAHLRMNAYKQHIQREVFVDYNRRALDTDTYVKETIVRTNGKRMEENMLAEERQKCLERREEQRHVRSKDSALKLRKQTSVRLREHWLHQARENAAIEELKIEKIIGQTKVAEVRETFSKEFAFADDTSSRLRALKKLTQARSLKRLHPSDKRPFTANDAEMLAQASPIKVKFLSSVHLQSREEQRKLIEDTEEAQAGVDSYVLALHKAAEKHRMVRSVESHQKALKERLECKSRIRRRSHKKTKAGVSIFSKEFERVLAQKRKEGLVHLKVFH